MTTNATTTAPTPNPFADTLTTLQRRCCTLAGAFDALLEASPLHSIRVAFYPLSGRPWWPAVVSDAGGWEMQAGGWLVSLDRPACLRLRR